MRCAIYARVSTDEQATEGFSIPAQKERLESFIKSQGWHIHDFYIDDGYSAKNLERPQIKRMMKDIEANKFDVVVVYKLDRMVRSVADLHKLLKLFERNKVMFKSATEMFDTTSAMGRFFITLVGAMAEWERENIGERVKFGTQQMVEQGIRPGSPRPYGYEYTEGGELKIVEDEAKWVKFIFDKYATNGAQTIAIELNQMGIKNKKNDLWHGSSIRYILDNPIYAGLLRWDYRRRSGDVRIFNDDFTIAEFKQEGFQPIITKEQFELTQSLIKERATNRIRSTTHYPFSTIIRCSECGHKYVGRTEIRQPGNRPYRSYSCQGRKKYGVCNAASFSEEAMNEAFLKSLEYSLGQLDEIAAGHDINHIDVENSLLKIQNKKERAKELYIEGDISKKRYQELMNEYTKEENKLQSAIDEAEEVISTEEIKKFLLHLKDEWKDMDYEAQKKAIQSTFETITIKVIKKGTAGKNPKPAVLDIIDYQKR
ncbi:hypothetical protein BKP37_12950 [Anaerobacillus alkalilacustris]|uniref:Recombinase family protein n=1 Tax=Anaerobacillus alkalilacustris TaxID=393763 RepID=A0A1S2LJL2_9BACI|nr:recombinase family protein [Anaerobacillus alkalilacustris]OIJ12702.1 hypothetical protein BKP37_12950 [Anaerobacillus alkalilacustris]